MNRIDSLIDFTFRFLNSHGIGKRFQQVNQPVRRIEQRESVPVPAPVTGGPQPVVDLLDSSIEVEYSRFSGRTESPFKSVPKLAISTEPGMGKIDGGLLQQAKTHGISLPPSTGPSSSQGQEITGLDSQRKVLENSPAPESKSLLCTVLNLHCEVAVDDNQYGILTCKRDAVGICKHCGLPVCLNCVQWEPCCMAVRHEVIVQ